MARLDITYAGGRKEETEITQVELIIGRDDVCDVTLDDAMVSRSHARLYRENDGRYWIQDLKSKNGTLVNDKPVATASLRDGDRIGIGACRMTLRTESRPTVVLSDADAATQVASTSAWNADQDFDLPNQRLKRLYELNERLTGLFDRDDLLGEVLDICAESLRLERAGIAIWEGEGRPPQWIKIKNLRGDAAEEFRISRSLVNRTLHNGERILINDTAEMDPTVSMISNNIRSAMCVPMVYHQKVRGVVYGDRVTSTGSYTKEDIDFFAALARLGAMGLVNVKLVEELQRRQQVDMQMQLGREIQSRLLPAGPLVAAGLTIDALNDPGLQISGDYYDYFVRDDGLILVLIADVAGKGVPASLLMANLQAAVHLLLASGADLAGAVGELNRLICRNAIDSRFITGIIGLLDAPARTFRYVVAGHQPPYLLRGKDRVDAVVEMEAGLPLGVEPTVRYEVEELALPAEPVTLFLYTDGVTEAENERGEMFQEDRLADLLASNAEAPPAELISRVRRSIKQFTRNHPQSDDITMVAVRLDQEA